MIETVIINRRRLLVGFSTGAAWLLAACSSSPASSPAAAAPTAAPPPTTPPKPTAVPAAPTSAPKPAAPTAAPKPTAAPTPMQPVKWLVGFPSAPYFDNAFRMIGIKQGFYREAGIDVEFTYGLLANQLRALVTGGLQSIDAAPDAALRSIGQGADLKIFGSVNPGLPQFLYGKRDITSVQDLVGRSVVISGQGDLTHMLLRMLLAESNIPEDKVSFVPIGSGGTPMLQAVQVGKADAASQPVEFLKFVQADPNLRVIGYFRDFLPKYVRTAVTINTGAKPADDVIERFLTALMRSVRYAYSNRGAALAYAEEITTIPAKDLEMVYDWYKENKLWSLNLAVAPESIDYMQSVNLRLEMQQQRLPLDKVLDLSFQKRVVAKLGEMKE